MERTPRLFAFVLALLVALTSQELAAARGHVGQEVVLCTGGGLVTVTLDENGKPTGPAHFCPDGVGNFIATATALPAIDPPLVRIGQLTQAPNPEGRAQPVHIAYPARGPPRFS